VILELITAVMGSPPAHRALSTCAPVIQSQLAAGEAANPALIIPIQ